MNFIDMSLYGKIINMSINLKLIKNSLILENLIKELTSFGKIVFNASLASCTTYKTGGNADFLIEPFNEESTASIIPVLKRGGIPFYIIGGGSNLLISDTGLRGAVIKISGQESNVDFSGNLIYAGAALGKERFIQDVMGAGYCGIEFMAGIPGSVGGGIFMNAGTYMGCFSDILKKIKLITYSGSIYEADAREVISGYREMNLPDDTIIAGGYFSLPLSENINETKKCVEDLIKDRWSKHPMEFPSAGSVFKNPEGLSSWKLINDSGLKGYRIGGAMVSEKHTNFIINTGSATSRDIYNLIQYIQETVYKSSGVKLETEIKMMGQF
jgi:UDP-N-acetylmuramate dehydrogenase